MKTTAKKNQPGRKRLSRDMLTVAGLKVARAVGIDRLTMKRLGAEVSVTPMAIYRYFRNKSDLIDAVLDQFAQENDVCDHAVPPAQWADWLLTTYGRMYDGLQTMPSVYPYLSTASRFGPGASRVVTQTLDVLRNAGFNYGDALQATNALNGFVIGCAIMDHAYYKTIGYNNDEASAAAEPSLRSGLNLIIAALEHKLAAGTMNEEAGQ